MGIKSLDNFKLGNTGGGVIKSRQVIVTNLWNGDSTNTIKNVTIPTPVSDVNNTIVTISHGNGTPSYAATYVQLIDNSTVRCTRHSASASSFTQIITVIEFYNVKSKQTGVTAGNTASITISSVEPSKCLLVMSFKASYAGSNITKWEPIYLSASTTITNYDPLSTGTIAWQVLEFN